MLFLAGRKDTDYFIPIETILFFEIDNRMIYAHTADNIYKTFYRLYEPEEFRHTKKQVYVSRKYYKALLDRMSEQKNAD